MYGVKYADTPGVYVHFSTHAPYQNSCKMDPKTGFDFERDVKLIRTSSNRASMSLEENRRKKKKKINI